MPFTPAHTVAAVPFARLLGRFGAVSALAIGSMTPDLAYFLPFEVARWQSHSLPGLLWFCLPVGVATWLFFHMLVAPLVCDVAPAEVRARLPLHWARGALPDAPIAGVAVCIVLGAITHLVWDSFTHWGTPLTRALPVLARPIGEIGGFAIRPVRVAQHLSTALGLALLAAWGWRWLARPPVAARGAAQGAALAPLPRIALVVAVLAPPLWLGLEAGFARARWSSDPMRQVLEVAQGLIYVGGSTFGLTLAVVGGGWRLLRRSPAWRIAGGPGA